MSHRVIRPYVTINQIYANKEVEIKGEVMSCENKSSYMKVLAKVIGIVHQLCGSKMNIILLDLQHMMFYFTDYKLFCCIVILNGEIILKECLKTKQFTLNLIFVFLKLLKHFLTINATLIIALVL
ncbi:hypothetical protein QQP08_020018 [Theobroma cacao]|nr:hypothetical protein QQP08_020018 [Theobroma cacao]